MKQENKNKVLLCIGILAVVLLILLRFGVYFIKSDGFQGLSMTIPLLLLCFLLLQCALPLFLQRGYIRIVSGGAMMRCCGRLSFLW